MVDSTNVNTVIKNDRCYFIKNFQLGVRFIRTFRNVKIKISYLAKSLKVLTY